MENTNLTCDACSDEVTARRSVLLTQPTIRLCVPCHEANLDNLYSLCKEFDKQYADEKNDANA